MVELNTSHINPIQGIQLVVDLNHAKKAKDNGKRKWKLKSI